LKVYFKYIIILFCTPGFFSCKQPKKINKYISLWRKDKIPYGDFYAYENLSSVFPRAIVSQNARSPQTFYYSTVNPEDSLVSLKTYIIISPSVVPEKDEVDALIHFAASGHQVFISALKLGDSLLDALHLKVNDSLSRGYGDSLSLSLYEPVGHHLVSYQYPGYCLDSYFDSFDTAYTQVLGRNQWGKPDFIRMGYRHGGAIFIHLAPMAFSNFFLLHRQNKSYYDFALSYLPKKTTEVLWDDYFRYKRRAAFSALDFILNNRSLKWAFWLIIGLFLLLYVFESKRKQRALVNMPAPGNASVDFVKTVGRLYLQQKNNQNLATKMIAAFLEHVRTTYHIPTSALNDEFSKRLALRTGKEPDEVAKLVDAIHEARMQNDLSDGDLMNLQQHMEHFYKL
jgi:hypothetical protein